MSDEIEIFPKSSIIGVLFETALPCDATKDEILEWISHNLGQGGISMTNPLVKHEMESLSEPILKDTMLYLHQSVETTSKGHVIKSWKERTPYTGPDPMDVILGTKRNEADSDDDDE